MAVVVSPLGEPGLCLSFHAAGRSAVRPAGAVRHIELAVFLGTIASIPTLVRALDPQASGRRTWVAIFLFPGIFLYDGNLHVGADHMAALWCIPLALTFLRVWRSWTVRNAVLFGAITGAVIFAKYSAWSMRLFPSCAFLLRAAWLGYRRLRGGQQRVLPALLSCGAMVFLISAPFWLKNWIAYGDPLYPVFYRHLNVHPWTSESAGSFKTFCSFQSPPAPSWDGVKMPSWRPSRFPSSQTTGGRTPATFPCSARSSH